MQRMMSSRVSWPWSLVRQDSRTASVQEEATEERRFYPRVSLSSGGLMWRNENSRPTSYAIFNAPQRMSGRPRNVLDNNSPASGGLSDEARLRGRHACGGRPFGRRHDGHHVGAAGRDVHLRQCRPRQQQDHRHGKIRRKRRDNHNQVCRDVREHHRVHQAETPGDSHGQGIRKRAKHARPEKEHAGHRERDVKALEQPDREQRLHGKAARECVDAEQRGELVDNPP
jgi:hypothetical protein